MTAAAAESRSQRRGLGLGRPRPAGSLGRLGGYQTDLRGVLNPGFAVSNQKRERQRLLALSTSHLRGEKFG
jgi:hypothetical protein